MVSRKTLAWPLGLCLAVIVTARYEGAPVTRDFVMGDAYEFLTIAAAAPGLPDEPLLFHHSQRLAVPYTIGLLHRAVAIPIHRLFQASAILITLAILLLLAVILERLSVHPNQAALALAVLAFNPWAFRPVLTFPEMINDLGFVLGVAIMMHGLLVGHGGAVLLGQLVASLTRQTGVMLVPVVAVWLWRDRETWGMVPAPQRLTLGLGAAAVAAAVYAATAWIAVGFSAPSENVDHLLGAFSWFTTQFDAWILAAFLARAIMLPIVPLALLAVAVGFRKRAGSGSGTMPILLFASACIWAQPLLAGPDMTGGNAQRLMALGLFPLSVALGVAFRDAGVFAAPDSNRRVLWVIALLLLGSLHHWYVLAAEPSLGEKAAFVTLFGVAGIGSFLLTCAEAQAHRSAFTPPSRQSSTTCA